MAIISSPFTLLSHYLAEIGKNGTKSLSNDERQEMLKVTNQLQLMMKTPTETLQRLIYQPPQNAALRTVVDLGIFPIILKETSPQRPISAAQLAERTGADQNLIVRLMRVMASLGLCTALTLDQYAANEKTAALAESFGQNGISCIYDLSAPALAKLPEYFRSQGYLDPQEYESSPMQWAVGQSQFEWLASNKDQQSRFNSYMACRRQGKPKWFDVYPISRLLGQDINPYDDTAFLVDIGGNQGHDLNMFKRNHKYLPGKVILQDLPEVVESISGLEPGIEVMGYSFFDPQPVKGARAYFFRSILHDWPDQTCRQILRNTVDAMAPDYSSILIMDFVLPEVSTPLFQASLDIQMMTIGAGAERSESQWGNLLHSAGLEIVGIWRSSPQQESVIEAVPIRNASAY